MSISLNVDGGAGRTGYLDTLAQSFFVDRALMLTKIDLYFSEKHGLLPVELTLRKVENDLPSPNVITNSSVVVDAANINTSSNSTVATTFTFANPLYLESGQYCFTLSSDSKKNKVYVAEIGGVDIATDTLITKQPYAGVVYLSSNGTSWDVDQTKDIKFKIYRANITSTTATVDMVLKRNNFSSVNIVNLETDPFISYNGTDVVRVLHDNHGFSTGARVKFNGLPGTLYNLGNANIVARFNGINFNFVDNVEFTVSNVTNSSYTIILGTNVATTANITEGRFGGSSVVATTYLPYSSIYPSLSLNAPAQTAIAHKIKTTDTSLTVSSLQPINPDVIDFDNTKLIVDPRNRAVSMSGQESFVYRVELLTNDNYVSPTLTIPNSSVLFVTPDINYPASTDNLTVDIKNIATANTLISFSSAGVVSIAGTNERANVKSMVPGAFVTITGAGNSVNNGTFRLTSVSSDGSTFSIPSAATEPTGNSISISYRPRYIAEEAANGSSSKAKYITRKIELATPATGMLVRFAVSKPTNTDVEVYYKTRNVGDVDSFETKEYAKLTFDTPIKTTVKNQFVEVSQFVDNLTPFDALSIKIVYLSSDIAYYPEAKDLRVIALA